MKLSFDTILTGISEALRDQISPKLDDSFDKDVSRLAQTLLNIVALARDDEVAIRVEENRRMREIFGKAAEVVDDSALAARLADAALSADPGLRISELDRETGRLRTLLVELHALLEEMSCSDSQTISQAIWRSMRDAEMARAPRA